MQPIPLSQAKSGVFLAAFGVPGQTGVGIRRQNRDTWNENKATFAHGSGISAPMISYRAVGLDGRGDFGSNAL